MPAGSGDLVVLAAALTLLIWLYLLLARGRFWRVREERLDARPSNSSPRVAVIIPARNEAVSVAAAVSSVLRQDYPGPFQVFLVDDHSTDHTAQVARGAARDAGKSGLLEVVPAPPLPPGWTGKLWALSEGVCRAAPFQPDLYWFTDADVVHSRGTLAKLVAKVESGWDLVSLMVRLRCETFAEKATVPAFLFFFFKLYPPAWTRDPGHTTAGAAGGCLLVRREALERAGGIETIRGEVIDDCALAREVKRSGGKVWLGLTAASHSIRSYGTFAAIAGMISRTAYTQLRYSPLLLAGTVAGMFVTYLLPPLLSLTVKPPAAVLGGLAWLLMSVAYVPSLRFYRRSVLWAPSLPLVALFYTGATVASAKHYWRGRGAAWKDRFQATP
jgi:hopene-associated glycosyltransferase HpnB